MGEWRNHHLRFLTATCLGELLNLPDSPRVACERSTGEVAKTPYGHIFCPNCLADLFESFFFHKTADGWIVFWAANWPANFMKNKSPGGIKGGIDNPPVKRFLFLSRVPFCEIKPTGAPRFVPQWAACHEYHGYDIFFSEWSRVVVEIKDVNSHSKWLHNRKFQILWLVSTIWFFAYFGYINALFISFVFGGHPFS